MSALFKRAVAVDCLTPATDHSGKRGYLVKLDSNKNAALVSSAADIPYGVILDGEDINGKDSVAVLGGNLGTVVVKVQNAVTKGAKGVVYSDGRVAVDPGTGARVAVCLFMEDGTADELVEAIPLLPQALS